MNGEGGRFGRVDPNAIVLGVAVAIAVIVIGTGIAIYVSADSGRGASRAASISTDDSTTTTHARTTTTTLAPSTPSTTAVLPNTGEGSQSSVPETPRATSDPEDDPFVPVPLPFGVGGATVDSCTWSSGNGGELQATGTITSTAEDDLWGVEVYWLQNDRELDSQYEIYEFTAAGQTVPWRLTIEAPLPPLDLRCAIIVD